MTLLKVIIRKMLNNRWLTGSLFLGMVITVALVSSIPTYTSSIMQKLLVKELEDYQIEQHEFPGGFTFSDTFSIANVPNPGGALDELEQIKDSVVKDIGLPVVSSLSVIETIPLRMMYAEEERRTSSLQPGKLLTVSGLEEHITITDGRPPSKKAVDGVWEALVSEHALQKREIVLNTDFIVGEGENQFLVRPVGTFQVKSSQEPYLNILQTNFSDDFIVNESLFREELIANYEHLLGIGRFSTAFDIYELKEQHIPALLGLERSLTSQISAVKNASLYVQFPVESILRSYAKKR